MFVSYYVHLGAFESQIESTLKPSAGAMRLYFKTPHLAIDQPEPNSIFVIDHGKGKGHTAFVVDVEGTSYTTIESNTNDEGSREGYEVGERTRHLTDDTYLLRIG